MAIATNQIWYSLVSLFSNHELSFEEARKRVLFGFICISSSVVLFGFGAYHYVTGNWVEAALDISGGIVLILGVYFVRFFKQARMFYRLPPLVTFFIISYFATMADAQGFRMLWMYVFPPTAMFLLGRFEGLLYSVLLGLVWVFALFVPTSISGPAIYDPGFSLRFVSSYGLLVVTSLFLESVRIYYAQAVLEQTSRLELDNEQMQNLAFSDDLTQLPNRRSANHFLDDTLAAAHYNTSITPLVGILDIDRFKVINDHFGHKVGDQVLAAIAQRVRGAIRSEDFIGRYGGEEFLIVIPNASPLSFEDILEKIRWAICENPIEIDSVLHHVTASIGAARVNSNSLRDDILESADRALYKAKQSGRNRVVIGNEEIVSADEQHTVTIAS